MFVREIEVVKDVKLEVEGVIDDIDDAFGQVPDYIMGGDEDEYGLLGSLENIQYTLGDIKGKLEELLKKS
jgi:archaellum component FlaC|tara:strand:+ start:366 stop:575 length:210 start_codon:yes stop_codon:yes gene_type:complete